MIGCYGVSPRKQAVRVIYAENIPRHRVKPAGYRSKAHTTLHRQVEAGTVRAAHIVGTSGGGH